MTELKQERQALLEERNQSAKRTENVFSVCRTDGEMMSGEKRERYTQRHVFQLDEDEHDAE